MLQCHSNAVFSLCVTVFSAVRGRQSDEEGDVQDSLSPRCQHATQPPLQRHHPACCHSPLSAPQLPLPRHLEILCVDTGEGLSVTVMSTLGGRSMSGDVFVQVSGVGDVRDIKMLEGGITVPTLPGDSPHGHR